MVRGIAVHSSFYLPQFRLPNIVYEHLAKEMESLCSQPTGCQEFFNYFCAPPQRRRIWQSQVMIRLLRSRPDAQPLLAIIIVCTCRMQSFSLVCGKQKGGNNNKEMKIAQSWKSLVKRGGLSDCGTHLQTCRWHASLACALFVQPGLHRKKCRSSRLPLQLDPFGRAHGTEGRGQRAKGTDDDDGDVGEEWGPWACRHGHARTSHSIYGPVAAGDSDE